jgi:hypothetical protein
MPSGGKRPGSGRKPKPEQTHELEGTKRKAPPRGRPVTLGSDVLIAAEADLRRLAGIALAIADDPEQPPRTRLTAMGRYEALLADLRQLPRPDVPPAAYPDVKAAAAILRLHRADRDA